MIRVTLAQMRRSLPRLVSAGIAILIGTAFVAATLAAGGVFTRTAYDAVSGSLAQADLVVRQEPLTDVELATVRATEGVAAADGRLSLWAEVASGGESAYPEFTVRASDDRLEAQTLTAGRYPEAPGEVALPGPLAERLGVGVGDEVSVIRYLWDEEDDTVRPQAEPFAVVGTTADAGRAFVQTEGAAIVHAQDALRWFAEDTDGAAPAYESVALVLDDGADLETVRARLRDALPEASVQTKDERAAQITAELTGDSQALTAVVLAFAAVALVVAALVVANTFQVLVAQRTRTLALLRCVGADKRQVRRSVLVEATLLGVAASLAGVLAGLGLAQGTLTVLGRANPDVPLPDALPLTWSVLVVPVLVGAVVTLVAALAPARAATRVAPLAALRPADAPVLRGRAGLGRVVLAGLLTVGGFGLLAYGILLAGTDAGPMIALPVGVLGGTLSFVGVLVGAVLWVPRVVALIGRPLAGTGAAARLAAANTLRNPRRTSATSAALLIGVTLVTMMSTGAASTRATLENELTAQFPVDALVVDQTLAPGVSDPDPALTPDLVERLATIDGVAAVATMHTVGVEWRSGDRLGYEQLRSISPEAARDALLAPAHADGLADGTVVVGEAAARDAGVVTGDTLEVRLDAEGTPSVALEVVVTDFPGGMIVTPATLERMDVQMPVNEAWLRFDDGADLVSTMDEVQAELAELPVLVLGAALERVTYEQVINTMLAVVVGLLAAAVVIALIGVANTLSLSVIERRRESATLRAIGMSRGQLRASLAVEGVLIAGVGAVLGSVLGVGYGFAGALTTLRGAGAVSLALPWRDLALVLAVAVAAGLLASVLPARSAVRTSPVEALAVE